MSKISRDGYDQLLVIKSALDSMFDKLNRGFYVKDESKKVKDIEKQYTSHNVFDDVKNEFEAIAGIVEQSAGWEEV
tara:strand:- start:739 stop:966 length:228 start_codon:yes stop_codon:yes gene_type:complete